MTEQEINQLVEDIIRIRDSYDMTREDRASLADASNIIYQNIKLLVGKEY